jgi:type I restriction enzyme S subunit
MKLAPYPEYKESGVSWLGKIPAHWDCLPHRAVFSEVKDQGHIDEPLLSVTIAKGIIPQSKLLANSSKKDSSNLDKSKYKLVCPDDIVYNKMRAWQGAIGVSRYRGIVSPAYIVVRLRRAGNPNYFHYLLRTPLFAKEAERWSYGITPDMWSLRPEHFKLIYSCVPRHEEQTQIARFLDWKTAQINKFIRNKRRLIELLKEQKQNIINQAVTRGLDPKVKLKPSGVEWIGDIPEHWEVRRLKFLCHNLNEQTSEKQPGETYIALEHVESWTGRISLPDDEITFDSQVKRFQPGDVLFGKLRPYLAKVTRPQTAGVCVGEFLVLRATGDVSADFLEQKLRSKRVIDLINSSTFGAKMPRADWTFIGNLKFAYPPADEQREILEHIQEKSAEIDQAISRAQREIELMREYRTRLISDVVTGQVDVRGIEVPEVAEDELLALEEDTADVVIDDEGDMDETD